MRPKMVFNIYILDYTAELAALLGIMQGSLESALRNAHRQRCHRNKGLVEHVQGVDKPLAFLTEKIFFRDAAVFKNHLGGVAGSHAELAFFLAGAEAGSAALHNECGDAVMG